MSECIDGPAISGLGSRDDDDDAPTHNRTPNPNESHSLERRLRESAANRARRKQVVESIKVNRVGKRKDKKTSKWAELCHKSSPLKYHPKL